MEKTKMIWIASCAVSKKMSFEDLRYSDYMYGKEGETGEVWGYVEECYDIGIAAFKEKYSGFRMIF
jgi:hypothetical protein